MGNILDLLNSDLGKQLVQGISSKTNATSSEINSVLNSALPAMLGGLVKNSSSDSNSIMKALENHNGIILDNLNDFFAQGDAVAEDGNKILGHIFGNNKDAVTNGIAGKSGVSNDKVSSIISMAAPVLMGYLGKQKSKSSINDANGLSGLLGGLLGEKSNVLTSLLDQNGDGKLGIDDVASFVSGNKSKGGLLGKLGGLFGGK